MNEKMKTWKVQYSKEYSQPSNQVQGKKICPNLQRTWDWGEGSPSSKTAMQNIKPVLQWNGLKHLFQNIFMCLEHPSQSPDLNPTQPKICV